MDRDTMYEFADSYFAQAKRLSQDKNEDYASNDDPFMNFSQCGELGIVTRMTDKVTRLKNLIFREFKGEPTNAVDEAIEDTLMDLFNYAWLLAAYRFKEGCVADDGEAYVDLGGPSLTASDPIDTMSAYSSTWLDSPTVIGVMSPADAKAEELPSISGDLSASELAADERASIEMYTDELTQWMDNYEQAVSVGFPDMAEWVECNPRPLPEDY